MHSTSRCTACARSCRRSIRRCRCSTCAGTVTRCAPMRPDPRQGRERGYGRDSDRGRRAWHDSDWRHWDEGAKGARCPADPAALQREMRWRRRAAWYLTHHRRHHQGGSLGGRLLATFIVASLLSIALAAVALETAFNWHRSTGLSHGLGEQVDWIESHLRFDSAGTPVALREPA